MVYNGKDMKQVPSGKHLHIYSTWPIEIVDLPNLKMVIFQFANCKRLPEDKSPSNTIKPPLTTIKPPLNHHLPEDR